ncbi:MAG: hypothetical protein K2W82_01065 [Candidatus Obscuribacterales bacterium]|nr:hypothetical protein [Candidatus Obscuribacterales bacterium]
MNSIFQATVSDVLSLRLPATGDRFTQFCDSILRAQAHLSGVKQNEILSNLQTAKPDGGVDTQINCSINDSIGFLNEKTIWQYKAQEFSKITNAKIREELKKPYATECIQNGYAYRLCVCDSLPPESLLEKEKVLNAELAKITNNSAEGRIVTAEHLAPWLSLFPTLVQEFFHKGICSEGLLFTAWGKNITQGTPKYVPVPEWDNLTNSILNHLNMSHMPADVVLAIAGNAGVGKTRLVYEIIKEIDGASLLVSYVADEDRAKRLATQLANTDRAAILISDESSAKGQFKLRELLKGHSNRVRIISIGLGLEKGLSDEYVLDKMPSNIIDEILEKNFPEIPYERRRGYSELAGGYIRLASDLCQQDNFIQASGGYTGAPTSIRSYIDHRLSEEEVKVVEALSLFSKIDYRSKDVEELDAMCSMLNLDKNNVLKLATKLHEPPGFITKAGRYLIVSPEIITQVALQGAWSRWVKGNETEFFENLPKILLEPFIRRISRSASKEISRLVGDHFLRWASSISSGDLGNVDKIIRFVRLIEIQPSRYLPMLRRLVEQATDSQLQITNDYHSSRSSSRRELVWLCERLASFPECFNDIEAILLRLAEVECEPNLGNNATKEWMQLFQIALSGTAVPFNIRLAILKKHLCSNNDLHSKLAIEALNHVLDNYETGSVRQSVVGGRVPPDPWRPRTNKEYRGCITDAANVLIELLKSGNDSLKTKLVEMAITRIDDLLHWGFLPEIRLALQPYLHDENTLSTLLSRLEDYLHFGEQNAQPKYAEYLNEVRLWYESLQPTDIHGKIVTLFGSEIWARLVHRGESNVNQTISDLAEQLYINETQFEKELEWLNSDQAKDSSWLGVELGKLDSEGKYLDKILTSATQTKRALFAKGYIKGILSTQESLLSRVNKLMDLIQEESPELAFDLFTSSRRPLQALERTISLFQKERLSIAYFKSFMYGADKDALTLTEFVRVLEILVGLALSGNTDAASLAFQFLASRLDQENREQVTKIINAPQVKQAAWQLLNSAAAESAIENNSYWWGRLLKWLLPDNPTLCAKLATKGVFSSGIRTDKEAVEILVAVSKIDPKAAFNALEELISSEKTQWRFFVMELEELICQLPADELIDWLKNSDLIFAQAIARHLPKPYLNDEGIATVPPLTLQFFSIFDDDDRAFHEFCAGTNSEIGWVGELIKQKQELIATAEQLLHHELRRIREWAVNEIETSTALIMSLEDDAEESLLD